MKRTLSTAIIATLLFSSCSKKTQSVIKTQNTSAGIEVAKKPKNIILMIGDGMGLAQIYAAMVLNGMHLNFERFKKIGFHKSYSADNLVTDSAAGATAFSTGKKTYNGAIGVNRDSIPCITLIEEAEKKRMSTGIVVTCSFTHATPASFVAHQPSRKLDEDIALDFMKVDVDYLAGGGKKYFQNRKDGRDLLEEMRKKGYSIDFTDSALYADNNKKIAAFLAEDELPKISSGRNNVLENAAIKGVEQLKRNHNGFFMMIEGSQIDWGGHNNDLNYTVTELLDFDQAIGKMLDFAEKDGNTLVIVTADHETGGLAINGGNIQEKKVNPAWTTKYHTGILIPVFAYGPGSEQFTGIFENTDIYHKVRYLFNW